MAIIVSTNPANYKKVGSVKVSTSVGIQKKIIQAQEAGDEWQALGAKTRSRLLLPLVNQFLKRKKEIALLTTREMGKPINQSLDDFSFDIPYLKAFLKDGPDYIKDEITYQDKKAMHKIVYEPWGVAAVIVPWNFPFANFVWGVIPTLIAGNTVVFKHSEECPLMGKLIEEEMNKLSLPKGVFAEIYGDGKIGETLVRENIDLIWFTGSSAVGQKLYQIAAGKFIPTLLELGGSNPNIIFEDINIDQKLFDKLYFNRFNNAGQVCDSLKRLIVHKSIFNKTVNGFKDYLEEKTVIGNPEDKKTTLGPLVAKRQLELLEAQVKDAVKKGAKVITGGKRPAGLIGAYFEPTILTNIKRNMRVWTEEVFGPVLPVVSFGSEKEAVELANDTIYGLGGAVFSKDEKRAERVAGQIKAGCININYGSHWQTYNPFGGYKISGMGREHGRHGFQELCQKKVISLGNV